MLVAPLPDNERERLVALRRYEVLDTEAEADIDELTRFASILCNTPIALVSLVDADRQWFKSRVGLAAKETPRELAFCAHAILGDDLFEVADAAADTRFARNPLVTGAPNIRFYASTPLVDDGGHALGTLCVIDRVPRELTPDQREGLRVLGRQVLARLELRRRMKELAEANAALAQARDAALAASRAKDVFLANMSHELRTPLNAILGYSELLLEEPECGGRPQVAADLRTIQRSGQHLLAIIEDILDLARLEAGTAQLKPSDVAVDEFVRQVEGTVRPMVERKRLGWRCAVEFDLRTLHTDPTRLRQILLNLLSNAIKFTDRGAVELAARRVPGRDRSWYEFRVSDTGLGIAADKLPLLFHEFTQVHETGRDFGGTGLGLALSRRYARLLGGDLTVDSEPGRGSTFTLRLPARAGERARAVEETAQARLAG